LEVEVACRIEEVVVVEVGEVDRILALQGHCLRMILIQSPSVLALVLILLRSMPIL